MKLTGLLKRQVTEASGKEEARKVIAEAGMLLSDDELLQVTGGIGDCDYEPDRIGNGQTCPSCDGSEENGLVFFIGLDYTGTTRFYQCQCGCCFGVNNF